MMDKTEIKIQNFKEKKMEINGNEYLTEEQISQMVKEETRTIIRKTLNEEREFVRIFSNVAYDIVWKVVDKEFDGKARELIKTKTIEIINGLNAFSVFKKKNVWDAEESQAYKALQEYMEEAKPLIKEKVFAIVSNYDYETALTRNADWFTESIIDALRKGFATDKQETKL